MRLPAAAFVLPETKSTPSDKLGDYTILLYGQKKIGKTSLAAEFPDAMFAMFEPGGKGLSIYQAPMPNWKEFIKLIEALKAAPGRFNTVVLDTIDIAYQQCLSYVCMVNGFEHPGDNNDFGKSWSKVRDEFSMRINDLIASGIGVVFISHAKEVLLPRERSADTLRIISTMSNQARSFVTGTVDIIAYYGYYGSERRLVLRGSDKIEAGHRIKGRFMCGDQSIFSIPMGNSANEGWLNICKAFNNEQEDVYEPVGEATLTDEDAKLRKKSK